MAGCVWGGGLSARMSHLHAKGFAQEGALHALPVNAENGEAGEAAVAVKVGNEMLNHIHWDDITDVLRILTLCHRRSMSNACQPQSL